MKYIKSLLAVGIIALLLPGCKKYLDVKSKTNVVQSEMFSNEAGFLDAMAGVYFGMSDAKLYGDKLSMGLMDILAGRYAFEYGEYYNQDYVPGNYRSLTYYSETGIKAMIDNIWLEMYKSIANTNNVIANIDARQSVFSGNNYKLVKGEAIGLRAFMHFDLLRMFGHSYLAGKDSMSIPYVRLFSAKLVTPLSTVKAVTDSVIADLNEALVLLEGDDLKGVSADNDWLNKRKCHFNYWAAEALLARVYLYRGDKVNALLHAKKVIDNAGLRFTTENELADKPFNYTFNAEQIFALNVVELSSAQRMTEYFVTLFSLRNLGNTCGKSTATSPTPTEQNIEKLFEVNMGGSADIRYVNLFQSIDSKYYMYTKYWKDEAAERNLVPLIRLPEMYYIAAECSPVEEGASYLNTVRKNRGLATLSGLSSNELQSEIFKEYEKEFIAEGQLFYYYKRLNATERIDYDRTSFNASAGDYVFPLPDQEKKVRGL